jgi:hypothetical protein
LPVTFSRSRRGDHVPDFVGLKSMSEEGVEMLGGGSERGG